MNAVLPIPTDDHLLRSAGEYLHRRLKDAERAQQRALADRNWDKVRPWFYDDFVIHPVRDWTVKAALRGETLPPAIERQVSWILIRMFARRLRRSDLFPRLTKPGRYALQLAIRCELRRLSAARHRTMDCYEAVDMCLR